MLLHAVAALLTFATPAFTPAPAKHKDDVARADILLLDLKAVAVDEADVRILDGLVAESVGRALKGWPSPPRLASGNDIRTMMSLDATKAAAGCDDASCMAEVAGAFGARYVLTGTAGRFGDDRVLQLWLFDVVTSQTLVRESATAASLQALAPALDALARRVVAPLAPPSSSSSSASSPSTATPPGSSPSRESGGSLVVGGAVTAGVAGALALGGGVTAAILDARLAAGSGAAPSEKRDALSFGPAILGATALTAAVAVVGLVLVGVGAAG